MPPWIRKAARNKRIWRWVALAVLLCVGVAVLSSKIDVHDVHERTAQMNGAVVFILIVLLPLFGFPVTVMHMLAGIRWGTGMGLALVAASILLQLLASYGLVHVFRPLFEKRLAPLRKRLPKTAHRNLTLFTMLLPGVPYFAKNYVLPLAGVPLRTYLLWSFPLHVLRSSIGVLFGDASDELNAQRIAAFAAYFVVIALVCTWSFRRLQRQVHDQPQQSPA